MFSSTWLRRRGVCRVIFFLKNWSSGAGGEIREANEKEEDLQAIQATRIEEGKLQQTDVNC